MLLLYPDAMQLRPSWKSYDKTLMEKVGLMEGLDDREKETIYNMLDAFVSKNKLKNALTNALTDI